MTDLGAKVAAIKAAYDGCFGCGAANPFGLQLDGFSAPGDGVLVTSWTPRPEYRGFEGTLHGGIVTAALDEVMAWAAMLLEGVAVVTGTRELRFSRPGLVDATYSLEGRVVERRGRRLMMEGRCNDGRGTTIASANAMFLVAGDSGVAR
jgi:acyl-coenzyme A thioesterase PaaI-like protein